MVRGWLRVKECRLCGGSRCVVNVRNQRMGYCYRCSTTFFINKITGEVNLPKKKVQSDGGALQKFDDVYYQPPKDPKGELDFDQSQ